MFTSGFTNRPAYDSQFLPAYYDLNALRISGWFAPSSEGAPINGPDHFQLHNLFVIAPRPDEYVAQMAFGISYRIVTPSSTDGDEDIVDGEVIKDKNGNIVYTNRRITTDIDSDGTIDTEPNTMLINVGGESYNILRFVTDDEEYNVSGLEHTAANEPINTDKLNDINNNEITKNNKTNENKDEIDSGVNEIRANALVEDTEEVVIINRSAIYTRSYIAGAWTAWTALNGVFTQSGEPADMEAYVDYERIYSYIDSKLTFNSLASGIVPYGFHVEVTGIYNDLPYDPDTDVFSIEPYGIEYDNIDDFPAVGDPSRLYVIKSENKIYRYDQETGTYMVVGSDWREIINIVSGNSDYSFDDENNSPGD